MKKIEIDAETLVLCHRLGLLHDDEHADYELWLWFLIVGMQIYLGVLVWKGLANSAEGFAWIAGMLVISTGRAAFLRRRRATRLDVWMRVQDRAERALDPVSYQHLQEAQRSA